MLACNTLVFIGLKTVCHYYGLFIDMFGDKTFKVLASHPVNRIIGSLLTIPSRWTVLPIHRSLVKLFSTLTPAYKSNFCLLESPLGLKIQGFYKRGWRGGLYQKITIPFPALKLRFGSHSCHSPLYDRPYTDCQ
jgi:hypothetical protein